MRAFLYIALIALVLWTGFTWEGVNAPPLVVTTQEEVSTSTSPTTTPAEEEVETEVLPAQLVGSQETLPAAPPAPKQVEYDETYVEALELAIHARINEERLNQGLKVLAYDTVLAQVAAYHSTDMAENDYFAHKDDEGCDSACRLTSAGYKWRMVGENLFLLRRDQHFSVEGASAIVVAGWMGSPGHRKNMFEPDFTHQGIGVVILGDALYVTEVLTLPH